MAKRGKGGEPEEKEEGYDFVPPDFDEDEFIHKEMISFRTTSTLIIVGILAAAISWAVFSPVGGADAGWWIGLLIVAASFFVLKPLYKVLKFDISHYGRREWIGAGFLLFFTWLAFFMILLNPPFSDHADPQIELFASPDVVPDGDMTRIDVFVADNDKVSSFDFVAMAGNGQTIATKADLSKLAGDHDRYEALLPLGDYTFTTSAVDPTGHDAEASISVSVVERVIRVFPVSDMDLSDPTKEILVTVPEAIDVWSVYADRDGNVLTTDDRVYFEYKEERSGYEATAAHKGWTAGVNNVTIIVEESVRFHGQTAVPGAFLKSGPFEVTVDNPGSYNPKAAKGSQSITPPAVSVPGLEIPILVVGLLAIAFIVRRK